MPLAAWAVIAGLILVNAFYVAAEFAAVGVRRTRVRALVDEGNVLARQLLPVVEDPRQLDRHIAATQIGITLTSLILGAFGQATLGPAVVPWLVHRASLTPAAAESTAAALILIGLTTLQVIFGELVPKSIALQHPTRSGLYTIVPMRWSVRLFAWFINVLNGSGTLLLRAFRVPSIRHQHIHSPEEIDLLLVESHDGGLLEPEEQRRLRRALRLGLRSARQLMVPRPQVVGVSIEMPFAEMVRFVADSPYTRLPVYRGTLDHIVGILHTQDILLAQLHPDPSATLQQIMRPALTVHETLP
ncbi:MAG: HlyC/CorC family transporter, partial [Acidobacteria bacterium]|nr:HlyC/CorC family transporter [Acidobacteriota bacterium]